MHLTNVSETIEAKYWVSWLSMKTALEFVILCTLKIEVTARQKAYFRGVALWVECRTSVYRRVRRARPPSSAGRSGRPGASPANGCRPRASGQTNGCRALWCSSVECRALPWEDTVNEDKTATLATEDEYHHHHHYRHHHDLHHYRHPHHRHHHRRCLRRRRPRIIFVIITILSDPFDLHAYAYSVPCQHLRRHTH